MTREELDFIGSMNMCDEISNEAYKKIVCHCGEQEPCEDAISRQVVLDEMYKRKANGDAITAGFIKNMPPVTPRPKMGRWIEHEWEEMREKGYYRCSVCNHGYQRYTKGIRKSDVPYIDGQEYILRYTDHYCPNCGAKMEVEE